MLFNSIDFAIFLPIVFLIYWFGLGKNLKVQNLFVCIASYVFYGWWDWRFLTLLLFTTTLDYAVGRWMVNVESKRIRKTLLTASIVINLVLLGIFKYLNFFIDSFVQAFTFFGADISSRPLDIILPVGISFYTFQSMSYALDVYKGRIRPTDDFTAFAAYVSFFPQLVAGPIERATNLLPQFFRDRVFKYEQAVDGMRQMLWGLFKKVVIADSCAVYVDMAFASPESHSASTLLFAMLLFPTQVYCDFSGYSDIAIGCARLFGFHLNRNFAFPFYSLTVSEFWRRWHISLYTWFKDYVFLPYVLSKKEKTKWIIIKATFITSVLIGFWHGANWTFILWGLCNGIFLSYPIIMNFRKTHKEFVPEHIMVPTVVQVLRMNGVFLLISLAAVLFRANDIKHAATVYYNMFSFDILTVPEQLKFDFILLLIFFHFKEWTGRGGQYAIQLTGMTWKRSWRWAFYALIVFLTGMYQQSYENPFIYFNF